MKLKDKYIKEVLPVMKEKFGYKNDLAVPRITKVVVNSGFNPVTGGEKIQELLSNDLALITGQRPSPCQVKKPEASFKTRKGMINGLKITLRGQRMYDFLDRLIHIALPRSRDFRGLPEKNIDQAGNLNIGIKEQIIFPEISAENVKNIFGFQITVVTTTKNHKEGLELFKLLGFPIK
jgi:large subunit ribosomal protein L5